MVNVNIFIERGVVPHDNDAVKTIENSEQLRESFYELFTQILSPQKFNLIVKLSGGRKQAINTFKSKYISSQNTALLLDLDDFKENKAIKIQEFDLKDFTEDVFFMVQEYEAWLLSQIDKIDDYYKERHIRRNPDNQLSDSLKIKDKHPEDIPKPSSVLKEIIMKNFRYKRDRKKKKKYNKLRDGAELLTIIDATDLRKTFSDFNSLLVKIENS